MALHGDDDNYNNNEGQQQKRCATNGVLYMENKRDYSGNGTADCISSGISGILHFQLSN